VPVFANGEVWDVDDWRRCRAVSGVEDLMLGRGDLSREGREHVPMGWAELRPLVIDFWQQARRKLAPGYAPGRLKQWLKALARSYPEAAALFQQVRREMDAAKVDHLLGVEPPLQLAA
jgi:tRNA-dihydrouridine synthase C